MAEYEVGTTIDLRWMNKKREEPAEPKRQRRVIERAASSGPVAVGTSIRFRLVGNKFITVRQIPVQFA